MRTYRESVHYWPSTRCSNTSAILFSCAFAWYGISPTAFADEQGPRLLQAAIEGRESLSSLDMEVSTHYQTFVDDAPGHVVDRDVHIIADLNRRRQEGLNREEKGIPPYRVVDVICPDSQIWYTERNNEGRKLVSAIVKTPEQSDNDLHAISDARLLGLVPTEFENLAHWSVATLKQRFLSEPLIATRTKAGSEDAWIVSQTREATKLEWVIVPDMGHAVVSASRSEPNGDKYLTSSVTLEYNRHRVDKTDIWFPRSFTYERHNGNALKVRQTGTITVHGLNTVVDDTLFTVAGVNPKQATVFYEKPGGRRLIWSGKELVSDTPTQAGSGITDPSPPSGLSRYRGLFLTTNALAFALIASVLIWKRATKNKRPAGK